MAVPRFTSDTLKFIEKASRQKRPDWLDRNRDEYERVLLTPLQNLARVLKTELSSAAPGYHFPQKGIGRIKRSADRARDYGSYYKDWISYQATRPSGSRFDHNPNLFFMIYPFDEDGDEVLVAGGFYNPSSRQLRAVREAIAADATAFDRLFASKPFAARFPGGFSRDRTSSRPPRGFDPNHPRIDWLKLQAFFVWRSYKKREYTSATFPKLVAADWAQIVRLNVLLEQAIQGPSRWKATTPKPLRRATAESLSSRLEEIEAPRRKMDF